MKYILQMPPFPTKVTVPGLAGNGHFCRDGNGPSVEPFSHSSLPAATASSKEVHGSMQTSLASKGLSCVQLPRYGKFRASPYTPHSYRRAGRRRALADGALPSPAEPGNRGGRPAHRSSPGLNSSPPCATSPGGSCRSLPRGVRHGISPPSCHPGGNAV